MEPATVGRKFACGHGVADVLKQAIDIKPNTVKIVPNQKDPEKHHIEFTFDAHVAGIIRLYYSKFVAGDYDADPKMQWRPTITRNVKHGLGQKFIQDGDEVEFPLHKKGWREVYNLDIKAIPTEDASSKDRISQTTRVVFDMVDGKTQTRVTNQIIFANGSNSVCVDFTGFRDFIQNVEKVPFEGCLICYSRLHPGMHQLAVTDKVIGN